MSKRGIREMLYTLSNYYYSCLTADLGKPTGLLANPAEGTEVAAPIVRTGSDQMLELGRVPGQHVPDDFVDVNAANSSKKALQRWSDSFSSLIWMNLKKAGPPYINQENPGHNSHCPIAEGIGNRIAVSAAGGNPTDPYLLLSNGINEFGARPIKSFLTFVWETLKDATIVIPGTCAFVYLVVGIAEEGFPTSVYEGLGLVNAAGVLVAVFVKATRNYKQYSVQNSKNLNAEKKKITVHESSTTGDGCGKKISICDVLPDDISHLRIGDKVPADGIFIPGPFVLVNVERQSTQADFDGVQESISSGQGSPTFLDGVDDLPTTPSSSHCLQEQCPVDNPNDLNQVLAAKLESPSIEEQKKAAMVIRFLTKNCPETRLKITKAGAIELLIPHLESSDSLLQEHAVTAILNLALCEANKELIVSSKATKPLVQALETGNSRTKRNAACALFYLSHGSGDYIKSSIGWSGAIPVLVKLLQSESLQTKKDAAAALYSLCTERGNKLRAFRAGIMEPLLKFMEDFSSHMTEKSASVLNVMVSLPEAKTALVEGGGIPVLVKMIETGWRRLKETVMEILLQICEDCEEYRIMVASQGDVIIPHLLPLSQFRNNYAMQKAETLIKLLNP